MIEIGKKAPAFTLQRDGGPFVSLEDFKDRWVVLFFYPKDLTSGCTSQAITFTEKLSDFHKHDAVIIGISPDSVASHDKFIKKHDLKIILCSDESKKTLESYEVWKEKKMYGRTYMGVERSTFLVDRHGTIKEAWRKVKVPGHVDMVLNKLIELTS